jgi:hypothetical protein
VIVDVLALAVIEDDATCLGTTSAITEEQTSMKKRKRRMEWIWCGWKRDMGGHDGEMARCRRQQEEAPVFDSTSEPPLHGARRDAATH